VNGILIFLEDTLKNYKNKVTTILKKLQAASLRLDINKYECSVKTTKYLEFIIKAGKGLRMDSKKVKVIIE
jgi:hypothetical protein